MRRKLTSAVALCVAAAVSCVAPSPAVAQKFEGLARTPPMGWNSWNTFATKIDENLIKGIADSMIESGMRDAGYVYIVLDDAWMAKERDKDGNLIGDPTRFPSGMKALGDYLHERGFKFGLYNCAGTKTCASYPGTKDNEERDAKLYAGYGVDYLKFDWCNTRGMNAPEAYKKMSQALKDAGRPIVFSLCEWGSSKPWTWAKDVGQLWRTTGDIYDAYNTRNRHEMGWKIILDSQVGLEKYAGPGGWNDPDMLEVGNEGLTFAESQAHFALWSVLAAPLMAGNDVRRMTPEIKALLTDREIIAINQDKLGKQGFRHFADPTREVWVKELSGGDWAVCVHNPAGTKAELATDFESLPFLTGKYAVRDIFAKKDLGTSDTPAKSDIDVHGAALYRLTPVK